MRILVLMAAMVLPSGAIADSCIRFEGSTLINKCQSCTEVTARERRPRGEQALGLSTGQSRTVRLEAGARETLQGSGGWVITDLGACH